MLFVPIFLILVVTFGYIKRVNVFDEFVAGARDGFLTVYKIAPYLLTMLFAIDVFRRSGALDYLINFLMPITNILGIPKGVLPMFIIKPLSGSGSLGLLTDICRNFGVDSIEAKIAAVMMGSTETIFYTLTVYFGVVGIKNTRHAVLVSLLTHVVATIIAVRLVF
ncbi:Spore maturation protein B [Caloramator mitchellensis]|uniref:Spore maturation protein B n=1 Tax=Caloramator mitchellensis TaxID=908809 RepID=A0A0R3JS39_CALMK|nr:nucleoside recognition domain-containing protein [Caloramator mitchellensis]KRQ86327.1 Spore maturation protein B [Caloramator mitchellensis]